MISILLPLHNGIEFLGDSISSIRNQTYPSWELLIGVNGVEITSEEYRLVKNESGKLCDLGNRLEHKRWIIK